MAHSEDIRDAKGNLIGRIVQEGSTKVLRDPHNNMLGKMSQGVTYDPHGKKVGDGDQLMRLLR